MTTPQLLPVEQLKREIELYKLYIQRRSDSRIFVRGGFTVFQWSLGVSVYCKYIDHSDKAEALIQTARHWMFIRQNYSLAEPKESVTPFQAALFWDDGDVRLMSHWVHPQYSRRSGQ
jgi:hypothetical protein